MLSFSTVYAAIVFVTLGGGAALGSDEVSPQTLDRYHAVGRLVPEYVSNLACAEDEIGTGPFLELKENVQRHFGDKAAATVQADHDKVRMIVERTPPSERPAIVRQMRCVEEAARLAKQLKSEWGDAVWSAERDTNGQSASTAK